MFTSIIYLGDIAEMTQGSTGEEYDTCFAARGTERDPGPEPT
jgi:hypothetical protein